MEEPSDVPELTPEQQILFDIETDKILENVPEDKVEISNQDEQQLEEVLNLLRNKAAAREEEAKVIPKNDRKPIKTLSIDPIPALAAAELVKATVDWEDGQIRFLQSPMRSDLAIEVLVNEEAAGKYREALFLLSLSLSEWSLIVIPDESAIFCGVTAEAFSGGATISYEFVSKQALSKEYLPALQYSKENLRSPRSLKLYRELINKVESQS